jgi:hypothetical protein
MEKLIDTGEPKPPEMKEEFWDNLVKKRGTRDWKALSETMINVAKHQGVRNKTRVRIEKAELIRLVSRVMLSTFSFVPVMSHSTLRRRNSYAP